MSKPIPRGLSKFYVVTMVFNPRRFSARWRNYMRFKHYCECSGAQLFTVEVAFGDRPFEVTTPGDPMNLCIRTYHELWHKERALNLAIRHLPFDWEYVAWIDADVEFAREDWVEETVHLLQHYMVIQMFTESLDLGPNYEPLTKRHSFLWTYLTKGTVPKERIGYSGMDWHSGFAWAARREAIEGVGGLIDWAIHGGGDWHMAWALIGEVDRSMNARFSPDYRNGLFLWQERAERNIRRDLGFMKGLILHYYHGSYANRKYAIRWQPLAQYQFSQHRDLMVDAQGLYQLVDDGSLRSIRLRDDIRRYFEERNEDDTHMNLGKS